MAPAIEDPIGCLVVVGWLAMIGWVDMRERRIPNDLLVAMLVGTVGLTVWRRAGLVGTTGWDAAKGAGMAAALFLPSYALKGLGAGDAKLGIVLGVLLGSGRIITAMLISGIALGIAALLAYGWGIYRGQPIRKIPAALPLSVGVAVVLVRPSLLGVGG